MSNAAHVFKHGIIATKSSKVIPAEAETEAKGKDETAVKDGCEKVCIEPLSSMWKNRYNTIRGELGVNDNRYNDRLVYDISTCNFPISADPIDDRIKKNLLITDWVKRLDIAYMTKYSYEVAKDPGQLEIYNMLSSMTLSREAINFLCIYISSPKAIYTEYYNSIRDIRAFLRDAGGEKSPCMIQIAAILCTLQNKNIIPINPTWGYIRTSKISITYGFASQAFSISTEHIIVLQAATQLVNQTSPQTDETYFNFFAASVGLAPNRFISIIEWLVLCCGNYSKTLFKKKVKSPLAGPLRNYHKVGSTVFMASPDGGDEMAGILLSNGIGETCSVLLQDGAANYVHPNVLKSLITVDGTYYKSGVNLFSVC